MRSLVWELLRPRTGALRGSCGMAGCLKNPQRRSARGPVSSDDFERQAGQFVPTRFDFGKVQALDDPDWFLRPEHDLVALDAILLIAAHTEIIHPHRHHAARDQIAGRLRRDVNKVLIERGGLREIPTPGRVASLEEHALAGL